VTVVDFNMQVAGSFKVEIRDRCSDPFSITSPVLDPPIVIDYILTDSAIDTLIPFFVADPARCSIGYTTSTVKPVANTIIYGTN